MRERIKVLVVEDDVDFAYLLVKELKKQEHIVVSGVCGNRKEALEKAVALEPDIVLMDLYLESSYTDGIEASRAIRVSTNAKVLILTAFESEDVVWEAARKSFACGYIFKNQLSLLVENIYAAAEGVTGQERIITQSALSCLSDAERSVFYMLLGREEHLRSSKKTIANQKTQILKKLGLDNVNDLKHIFHMYAGV